MSHTEQFQGTKDGALVRGPVTHHYRNIGLLSSLSIFVLDEPRMRTLQQSDPSDSLSTSPIVGSPRRRSPGSLRPHLNSSYVGGTGEAIIPTDYNCASRHQTWLELKSVRVVQNQPVSLHSLPHHLPAHSVPVQRPPGVFMHGAQVLFRKR